MRSINELCDVVRETAYALHRYHGHGHFERVYENGLCHRLNKIGLLIRPQVPIAVRDEDGTVLGDYIADLLVEERLIVEIKACRQLQDEHTAQLLGYLKGTGIEHGLLINFGSYKSKSESLRSANRARRRTPAKTTSNSCALCVPLRQVFPLHRFVATMRWKWSCTSRLTTRRTPSTRHRGSLSWRPMRIISVSGVPGGTVNVDC